MGLFDEKTAVCNIEGESFTFNINGSYAEVREASALSDATMLNLVLSAWSLGGQKIEIGKDVETGDAVLFEFPTDPTLQAVEALPLLVIRRLISEYGAAIGEAIPKPSGGR